MINRHYLGHVTGYTPGNLQMQNLKRDMIKMAETFVNMYGTVAPASHGVIMQNTRQGIRGRYRKAWLNIVNNRVMVTPSVTRLSAFVKYEKIPLGKYIAGKAPRLIQFRSYEYLYLLKSTVLGYSLTLKADGGRLRYNGQTVGTIFTKMHNNFGIAEALRESWDYFSDPIAICLDRVKFDGHYCEELLEAERGFWMVVCNRGKLKKTLFKAQVHNKGRTQNGVIFKTKGHRMSGEYTTSDGNGGTNYAMLVRWLIDSGLEEHEFRIAVNGDDSVVFIDRSNRHKLLPLDYFLNFNMETECDRIVDVFQQISYCQASPIRVLVDGVEKWYMTKEYKRSMERLCYAPIQYKNCIDRYLSGIGLCELATYSGIPVMQSFALRLLQIAHVKPLASIDRIPAAQSGNKVMFKPIADITRSDFELAFGLPYQDQLVMENQIAGDLSMYPNIEEYTNKYKNFVNIKPIEEPFPYIFS